jgi:hypothetical protein
MGQEVVLSQYGSSNSTFGFKNRIINGAGAIDQRLSGASSTPNAGIAYITDRWHLNLAQSGKITARQNLNSITPPAGFTSYIGLQTASAYTPAAGDYHTLRQAIEGYNVADLAWGTGGARSVTFSFWVYSSLTGTFGGVVNNAGYDRGYPYTYTIVSPNTWQFVSVTIPGDTTGTWQTGNGVGIYVGFTLGTGSTYNTGTTGAWNGVTGGGYTPLAPAGVTNMISSANATFYITGVQLEPGTVATSFDFRPYGIEEMLCKRYYWQDITTNNGTWHSAFMDGNGSYPGVFLTFPVTMRAVPSGSFLYFTSYYYNNGNVASFTPSGGSVNFSSPTNTAGLLQLQGISNGVGAAQDQKAGQWYCKVACTAELV